MNQHIELHRKVEELRWKTSNRSIVIHNPIKEFRDKYAKVDLLKKAEAKED
jgi:hypothetical protein